MRLMVSGTTRTVARLAAHEAARPFLGVMLTPATGNSVETTCSLGLKYCVDNAAFDWRNFAQEKYLALLRKVAAAPYRPVFVTVPDQAPRPGDADHSHSHDCTAYLFERWFRVLEFEGLDRLPLAFVAQNGLEDVADIPWECIEAVFVGGDDEFKLGDFVMTELVQEAKARGKWLHMGRVNGRRRLRHAALAGFDSVDGSSLSRFGDTYLHRRIAQCWLAEREAERLDALNERLEQEIALL